MSGSAFVMKRSRGVSGGTVCRTPRRGDALTFSYLLLQTRRSGEAPFSQRGSGHGGDSGDREG